MRQRSRAHGRTVRRPAHGASGDDGKEATLRLQGDYAADIRMFDRIETEALRMAAYMFCGLAMRCR